MNVELAIEQLQQYGPIPKTLSRVIRPVFIAPPDHTTVWSDWSAIEARVLPYLAGESGEGVLDIFRTNDADPSLPDVYKIEASGIYNTDANEVTKPQRQVGKVAILALGFGGGVGALSAMATGYGIHLEEAFKHEIVGTWRANNPWAKGFWDALNKAFYSAWDNAGTAYEAGRLVYLYDPSYLGGTMYCVMPDGTILSYSFLRREKRVEVDEDTGVETSKWVTTYSKGYEKGSIWHGILAENPTQGFAASILRNSLDELDRIHEDKALLWSGRQPVVGHTHDEIITQVHEKDVEEGTTILKAVMEKTPDFAVGLPLVAEVTENWFYSKNVPEMVL